ncbi:50S ribosomal protein L19 [Candidatus Gottesmanbacteria bacterium]|nr:50S ribosomal protein L19 [Candidatus Gottesmanbacteria bacterium]
MANQITIGETTFYVGDTIRVHYKLIEKEKVAGKAKREVKEEIRERIQVFEGIVLGAKGMGDNKSFLVRRLGTDKIGVERIFPVISPWIKKVEIKQKGYPRRAKLYYLRDKIGREADTLAEPTKTAKQPKSRVKKKTRKKSDTKEK